MAINPKLANADNFVELYVWAVRHLGPTTEQAGRRASTVRHLLREIAVYADYESGAAWPNQDTLAERLGCSRDTVSKATTTAEELGWIEVSLPRRGRGRDWRSNTYRLTLPPAVAEELVRRSDYPNDLDYKGIGAHDFRARPKSGQAEGSSGLGSSDKPLGSSEEPLGSSDKAAGLVRTSDTNSLENSSRNSLENSCARARRFAIEEIEGISRAYEIEDLVEAPEGWPIPETLDATEIRKRMTAQQGETCGYLLRKCGKDVGFFSSADHIRMLPEWARRDLAFAVADEQERFWTPIETYYV